MNNNWKNLDSLAGIKKELYNIDHMKDKKVIRVSQQEFELDDGSILPLIPPLDYLPSIQEIQEHYDRACLAIQSL